jgi:hypothetical protein
MTFDKNPEEHDENRQDDDNSITLQEQPKKSKKEFLKESVKENEVKIENSKIDIYITKKTVRFGSEVYQFCNVTGFGISEFKAKNLISLIIILLLAIVSIIARIYGVKRLEIVTLVMAFLAIAWNRIRPRKYGFTLYLNSGDKRVFITRNRKFLNDLISVIYEFMESNAEGGYVVNIQNQSINDKSILSLTTPSTTS